MEVQNEEILGLAGKACVAVLACILCGLLLLLAVYGLPTEAIDRNVAASAEVFEREGTYPILNMVASSKLDNCSDAVMLLSAAYPVDSGIVNSAVFARRAHVEDKDAAQALIDHYSTDADTEVATYARYWHGYLVVLKPLLSLFTYAEIRVLNAFGVVAVAMLLMAVMHQKRLTRYIPPFLLAFFAIDPFAVSQSLQFSTVYYILCIASILLLLRKDWLDGSVARLSLFFVVVGCATSYFDLLTYPLATFGVPMVFCLCTLPPDRKRVWQPVLIALVSWSVGYLGMWVGKWILGSLLVGENLLIDAIETIIYRTSDSTPYVDHIGILSVLKKNITALLSPAFAAAVVFAVVMAALVLWKKRARTLLDPTGLMFLAICILPLLWYIAARNHSFAHHWFTYRALMVSVLSGLCLLVRCLRKPEVQ